MIGKIINERFQKIKNLATGMELVNKIYRISDLLPSSEKCGLVNQITRAAVSIPANIVEGSSRNRKKDYRRFLQIALGSSFEVETLLLIIQDLKLRSEQVIHLAIEMLITEQRMISGFINKLN